jgi:hypothetical protein
MEGIPSGRKGQSLRVCLVLIGKYLEEGSWTKSRGGFDSCIEIPLGDGW